MNPVACIVYRIQSGLCESIEIARINIKGNHTQVDKSDLLSPFRTIQ